MCFFKKKFIILGFLVILFSVIEAQNKITIKGTIKDSETNEALIGASVMAKPGVGAVADMDGHYTFQIEPGIYTLKVNYVGYSSQQLKVKVIDKEVVANFMLESQTLDEVEVTANIGTVRETPVAISNISAQKIQEELGGRDLPMILNSTPGVYATQQGGGAGDARVTLRGFDQTNIAVMVDGVPVNDMENGAVYWSNWDGLSEITKTMQVQRGLGATKLAVSSAGGTMNILTKTLEQKSEIIVKQDYGNNLYQRTAISYNSGLLKEKFGIILAGSHRAGDGYIDGTFVNAWSYFVKLQWKVTTKHLLSLSANGAPQSHGQRNFQTAVSVFDKSYAKSIGIEDPDANASKAGIPSDQSRTYNYEMGKLKGKDYIISKNYYHKPMINLNHYWSPKDRFTLSTVAYASYGFGGGTGLAKGIPLDKNIGYADLSSTYNDNANYVATGNTLKYYGSERQSSNILRASINNHKWYGLLSTAIYKVSQPLTITYGVDIRYYEGIHYRKIDDLLGGDYYRDNISDMNATKGLINPFNPTAIDPNFRNEMKREGDKIGYNYKGLVNWGGLFYQMEYKKDKWTAFMTLTGSYTGYQRLDYFSKKDVVLGNETKGWDKFVDYFKDNRNDKTFDAVIGFNETLLANDQSVQSDNKSYYVLRSDAISTFQRNDTTFVVKYNSSATPFDTVSLQNGKMYTIDSKEAKYATTRKKWFPGFTIKGGVNYKLNSIYNVYVNVGYLSVAPKFNNVYNGNQVGNVEFNDANNQLIMSQEIGAGMKLKQLAANLNVYYTRWSNKPVPTVKGLNDGEIYNVNGVDAGHFGVEADWVYKIIKSLDWEGTVSVADWKYLNGKVVYVINQSTGQIENTIDFSAKGVHLGNAAQMQFSNALKVMHRGFYFKPRYTYFGKNYANFNATDLQGANKDRESWRLPDYGLLDLSGGYEFKLQNIKVNLNANVTNALNTFYISDATNNQYAPQNFDANSATVFIGMGRQFMFGMKLTF